MKTLRKTYPGVCTPPAKLPASERASPPIPPAESAFGESRPGQGGLRRASATCYTGGDRAPAHRPSGIECLY
jgi:hypothetical protein